MSIRVPTYLQHLVCPKLLAVAGARYDDWHRQDPRRAWAEMEEQCTVEPSYRFVIQPGGIGTSISVEFGKISCDITDDSNW